ncbi:MAG: alpha/beta hydrolase, partial [Rhodococcus sp.]|nr:alpha/beta hydrolase [Rhodococcus sp. (in: high G+C Gram-positive bacteria)]
MKTAGKMSILGGLLSAVALGSMARVNGFQNATRPGREIDQDEDLDLEKLARNTHECSTDRV